MRSKVVTDSDVVTYVMVCDPGEDAVAALHELADRERLEAASITGLGGFEHATVGWFDRAVNDFRRNEVDEPAEVLSLIGNVAEGPDGPSLNVHVVLGLADGTTRGGHLLAATVFPTLEAVVTETPAELRRVMRPGQPVPLIDLDQSD
ncbi:PPC domain-containing DNA-binding protein [Asanoa sp. NPDC049518]|uniref:PPC domain-containing DNA-binding protein n=1 Tax=unclassified Asanoa TaxID=2685164 RepID=UPI00341552B6